jgi:biotin operon repressor
VTNAIAGAFMNQRSKSDLRWELLALISPTPAPLSCVADDLKIKPVEAWSLIRTLQNQGYAIETAREGSESMIFANPAGWRRIERKASAYAAMQD